SLSGRRVDIHRLHAHHSREDNPYGHEGVTSDAPPENSTPLFSRQPSPLGSSQTAQPIAISTPSITIHFPLAPIRHRFLECLSYGADSSGCQTNSVAHCMFRRPQMASRPLRSPGLL